MLLGTHTPKLDDKGRVILPAKFRDDLGDGVVITRGQERCLYVFSTAEFERVHERIREAPLTNKQARDFLRTDVIVVCLIVYAFLGLLADFVVRSLERLLLQWRPTFTGR